MFSLLKSLTHFELKTNAAVASFGSRGRAPRTTPHRDSTADTGGEGASTHRSSAARSADGTRDDGTDERTKRADRLLISSCDLFLKIQKETQTEATIGTREKDTEARTR
jgi:hypothetical protein